MPRGVPKSGKRVLKHPRMVGVPKSVAPQIPPAPGPSMPEMDGDESMSSPPSSPPTMRKGGKVKGQHTTEHARGGEVKSPHNKEVEHEYAHGGKAHHSHTVHHVKEMKHEHGYAHGSKVKHHKEDGSSHHAVDHFKKSKKF